MRALVLSRGGNRGALYAGALEVLRAEAIIPELIVPGGILGAPAGFVRNPVLIAVR